MQYYVVLRGDTLEFQKTKPNVSDDMYVTAYEEQENSGNLWEKYRDSVKKVQFLDSISPVSTMAWFWRFDRLESFDKTNLDLSRTTDMGGMFGGCKNLQTLDLSDLDTSKVISMEAAFLRCGYLSDINLAGWDTSNVKNFQCMFDRCYSLRYLNINSFSMESAVDMSEMFSNCVALKTLCCPKQPAKQNIFANLAFNLCVQLKSLDLAAFGTLFSKGKNAVLFVYPHLTDIRVFGDNISELKNVVND